MSKPDKGTSVIIYVGNYLLTKNAHHRMKCVKVNMLLKHFKNETLMNVIKWPCTGGVYYIVSNRQCDGLFEG